MLKLKKLSIIDMMNYSLAVNSRISLTDAASLKEPAYLLGKQIATKGHTLLSPVGLNLAYRAASGASDKAGLSIGFSPAANFRIHIKELQLPTDVYDWLYFSNLKPAALLSDLIQKSQALILIGGVMANISELALASDSFLPVGILLDGVNQNNNNLLRYLKSLPLEKQHHIVVHKEPQVLLDTVLRMLEDANNDMDEKLLTKNNQFFNQLVDDIARGDTSKD